MNHKGIWLIALLGCGHSTPVVEPVSTPAPEVNLRQPAASMFGRPDATGRFLRVTNLKLDDGKRFGWRIKLPCVTPVEYVETMTLPSPGDWRQIEAARKEDPQFLRETTITADGRQTITHDYAPCVDGWIEHYWTIAKEDPLGAWTIKVEIPGYAPQQWNITFRP
jgi:hypothetical protein